ncbi:3963_t:CDS:2, partial [Entrophospora sp. SA101]
TISTRKHKLKKQLLLQNQPLFQLLDVHEKKIEFTLNFVFCMRNFWNRLIAESKKRKIGTLAQLGTDEKKIEFTLNFVFCMRNFWNRLIAESKKRKIGTLAQLGTENGLGTNRRKWIKEH